MPTGPGARAGQALQRPGYPRVAGALHVANGVLHVRSQAIAAIPEAIWNDDKTKRYRVSAGLLVAGRATLAG